MGALLFFVSFLSILSSSMGAILFEACANNNDCTKTIANSSCSRMPDGCGLSQTVCLCVAGYRSEGSSKCLKEAHLDQPCGDGSVVCIDSSSGCVSGRCDCLSSYRRNPSDPKRCSSSLITSQYGQPCRDSVQCDGTQECIDDKCACLAGYVYSQTLKTCSEIHLGDPCKTSDDCLAVFNAVCSGDDPAKRVCSCETGFLSTPVSLYGKEARLCLANTAELRDIGQQCIDDLASETFCKPNLVCTQCPQNTRNSVCTRPLGPTTPGPTLGPLPATKPGTPGIVRGLITDVFHAQATTSGYDYVETEYVYEDETTAKTVKITSPNTRPPTITTTAVQKITTTTEEFYDYDTTEEVITKKPVVKTTQLPVKPATFVAPVFIPTTTTTEAKPRTVIPTTGSAKTIKQPTTTENYDYPLETQEIPQTTPAQPGMAVQRVQLNARCAPPSIICDADNSQCIASRCHCSFGYEQLGFNYCHQIGLGIPLGQPCAEIDHCSTTGASCVNGKCQCPLGFKAGLKDDCVEESRNGTFNKPCEHSINCYYGLSCISYRCQCIPGTKLIHDSDCIPRVLGEACPSGYDRDCKFITNGVCYRGNCACREGYMRKSASECVEALWQQAEDNFNMERLLVCESDVDCLESVVAPKQSVCISKQCQCRPHFTLKTITNTCQYDGVYSDEGFACNYDSDCRTNGLKCIKNTCSHPSPIMSSALVNSLPSTGLVLLATSSLLFLL